VVQWVYVSKGIKSIRTVVGDGSRLNDDGSVSALESRDLSFVHPGSIGPWINTDDEDSYSAP